MSMYSNVISLHKTSRTLTLFVIFSYKTQCRLTKTMFIYPPANFYLNHTSSYDVIYKVLKYENLGIVVFSCKLSILVCNISGKFSDGKL